MNLNIRIDKLIVLVAIAGCLMACSAACKQKAKKPYESPVGYDFNNGTNLKLINRLEEISGIAFSPRNDSMLWAINDEEGRIYPVNLNDSKGLYDPIKFGKSGDYEDITWYDGEWVVLRSNGNLYRTSPGSGKIEAAVEKPLAKEEYEGMFADGDDLYVMCKFCKQDEASVVSIYKLQKQNDSLQVVDTISFNTMAADTKKGKPLRPSALARHPINGNWYILSHTSKLLVVADSNWQIIEVVPLKQRLFWQPEGIAFNQQGDLFISSEGEEEPGNIQVFKYSTAKQ